MSVLWLNADGEGNPQYDANSLRQAMALSMAYGGRALGARSGIRPGGTQLTVTLDGATITVAPGVALLDPALTTTQGSYWIALAEAAEHTLAAAHASSARKDRVVLRVYDDDMDESGLRQGVTEYIQGTPGSGVLPDPPEGSLSLAAIDVPASGGGSPVVTLHRIYTVASGGILPVGSQAERDAVAGLYEGYATWRRDTQTLDIYNGTGFTSLAPAPAPVVAYAHALGRKDFTWPSGFSVVDLVSTVEATGMTVDLTNNRITATTAGLYWIHGQVAFAPANGNRGLFLKLNNTTYLGSTSVTAGTGDATRIQVSRLYRLAAGDFVHLEVWTSAAVGDNGDLYGGQLISAHRVAP